MWNLMIQTHNDGNKHPRKHHNLLDDTKLATRELVESLNSASISEISEIQHKPADIRDDNQQLNSILFPNFKRSKMRILNMKSGFLGRRISESPLSTRPQPEEAQKWSESFSALMASKYGSSLYRAFLLREFSNENLEFWLAVEDYKNSKPQKMAAKAQQIYNDFVAAQASKEVNLDAETRLLTLTNIQSNNPDLHVFDRAQRRIQHMMERDSYLRFLQSELFLELVRNERCSASTS